MTSITIDNSELTSFGSVSYPTGVRFVSARQNAFVNLVGLPSTVEVLDVSDSKTLTSLQGAPSGLKQLIANNCGLITLDYMPAGVVIVEVNQNAITTTSALAPCTALVHLQIDFNALTSLQNISSTCKSLSAEYNNLADLQGTPTSLIKASFRGNASLGDADLAYLPTGGTLKSLDIFGTAISTYSSVPTSVRDLVVGNVSGVGTINAAVGHVRTTGKLYKEDTRNAKILSIAGIPTASALTVNANTFTAIFPFNFTSTSGIKVSTNNWAVIAPPIPFSAGYGIGSDSDLHIITSLHAVNSMDIRVIVTDISPYSVLLDTTAITTNTVTTHKFKLSRTPTNDCTIELQARLSPGENGNPNSKYGIVYAATMYS